jgi:hypothetical protein
MLEGLDRSWVEAGTARQASYREPRAGTYRFRCVPRVTAHAPGPMRCWASQSTACSTRRTGS